METQKGVCLKLVKSSLNKDRESTKNNDKIYIKKEGYIKSLLKRKWRISKWHVEKTTYFYSTKQKWHLTRYQ